MKRFLLSVCAVMLFAIAPASAKVYRDGNWITPASGNTDTKEWKALDAQHKIYSATRAEGHEAMANGEYLKASRLFENAAKNALWSWTQAWALNNAAYCLLKVVNHEDGLSGQERAYLEQSLDIYEDALGSCDTAEDVGEKLDQVEKCRAKIKKSQTALLTTLGR